MWMNECKFSLRRDSNTICWKLLSPLNFLDIIVKYELTTGAWGYFWTLNLFHWCMSVLIPISTPSWRLQLCSKFWNQEVCPPTSFFFQDCFGYSGSLTFPYELLDGLVNFYKEASWVSCRSLVFSLLTANSSPSFSGFQLIWAHGSTAQIPRDPPSSCSSPPSLAVFQT